MVSDACWVSGCSGAPESSVWVEGALWVSSKDMWLRLYTRTLQKRAESLKKKRTAGLNLQV